jgi:hypothetical protein
VSVRLCFVVGCDLTGFDSGHTFDVVRLNGVTNYVNPPRRDVVTTGPGTTTIRFTGEPNNFGIVNLMSLY